MSHRKRRLLPLRYALVVFWEFRQSVEKSLIIFGLYWLPQKYRHAQSTFLFFNISSVLIVDGSFFPNKFNPINAYYAPQVFVWYCRCQWNSVPFLKEISCNSGLPKTKQKKNGKSSSFLLYLRVFQHLSSCSRRVFLWPSSRMPSPRSLVTFSFQLDNKIIKFLWIQWTCLYIPSLFQNKKKSIWSM